MVVNVDFPLPLAPMMAMNGHGSTETLMVPSSTLGTATNLPLQPAKRRAEDGAEEARSLRLTRSRA